MYTVYEEQRGESDLNPAGGVVPDTLNWLESSPMNLNLTLGVCSGHHARALLLGPSPRAAACA